MTKIAILGAGFAGLAAAYYTTESLPHATITLFDPLPIGTGTSGLAAGLLHPYTGPHARLARWGREGMEATVNLVHRTEKESGETIAWPTGIFRPALSSQQENNFFQTAQRYDDVEWWTREKTLQQCRTGIEYPGIWIPQGIIIDCPKYLQGLAKVCSNRGVTFIQTAIDREQTLSDYDVVIGAMGAATPRFPPFSALPIRTTKGQILRWQTPKGETLLPFPLNGIGYLLQIPGSSSLLGGATFEREYTDGQPDPDRAIVLLRQKLFSLCPHLEQYPIVGCRAGIRISTPGHIPWAHNIRGKYWILTGFGSKGLLYHALFASSLLAQIVQGR